MRALVICESARGRVTRVFVGLYLHIRNGTTVVSGESIMIMHGLSLLNLQKFFTMH